MKTILISIFLIVLFHITKAQELIGITVKSNLLNLMAIGPSFSVEKSFAQKYALELSYSKGELNWGRDYEYEGFLLRGKLYAYRIKEKEITPFFGFYAGNLNKQIVANNKYIHPSGFISFGNNRNFKANSIRSGGHIGFTYLPFNNFVVESITGLGYGKYFDMQNLLPDKPPKGYFDFQLWLSIGYRF